MSTVALFLPTPSPHHERQLASLATGSLLRTVSSSKRPNFFTRRKRCQLPRSTRSCAFGPRHCTGMATLLRLRITTSYTMRSTTSRTVMPHGAPSSHHIPAHAPKTDTCPHGWTIRTKSGFAILALSFATFSTIRISRANSTLSPTGDTTSRSDAYYATSFLVTGSGDKRYVNFFFLTRNISFLMLLQRISLQKSQGLMARCSFPLSLAAIRRRSPLQQAKTNITRSTWQLATPTTTFAGRIATQLSRSHFSQYRNVCVRDAFLNPLLIFYSAGRTSDNNEQFCRYKQQLFHSSLSAILQTLKRGMTRPEVLQCPDRHYRRVIYGLGPYIADYPEQVWLAGVVSGWCGRYVDHISGYYRILNHSTGAPLTQTSLMAEGGSAGHVTIVIFSRPPSTLGLSGRLMASFRTSRCVHFDQSVTCQISDLHISFLRTTSLELIFTNYWRRTYCTKSSKGALRTTLLTGSASISDSSTAR